MRKRSNCAIIYFKLCGNITLLIHILKIRVLCYTTVVRKTNK